MFSCSGTGETECSTWGRGGNLCTWSLNCTHKEKLRMVWDADYESPLQKKMGTTKLKKTTSQRSAKKYSSTLRSNEAQPPPPVITMEKKREHRAAEYPACEPSGHNVLRLLTTSFRSSTCRILSSAGRVLSSASRIPSSACQILSSAC